MSVKWGMIVAVAAVVISVGGRLSAAEVNSDAGVERTEPNDAEIYIGAGAILKGQPYKGVESRLYPVPMFGDDGPRLYLYGISGGYRLFKRGGMSLGPVVQPRFMGYEEDESRDLAGMDDRDWTVDLGAAWSWRTDYGLFSLSWVADVFGKHEGHELQFSYTIMFPLAGFDIIPQAGVQYQSSNLTDYYYGVRKREAVGRLPYEAGEAFNPFVRVAVRRELSERWSLLFGAQVDWLDSEIKDSPIVEESRDLSLLAGLLYSF